MTRAEPPFKWYEVDRMSIEFLSELITYRKKLLADITLAGAPEAIRSRFLNLIRTTKRLKALKILEHYDIGGEG